MPLLELLIGSGLVVGTLVAGIVYADCAQRGLTVPAGLGRALASGVASFGGFLLPHVFSQQLQYLYFRLLKPRAIAVSPVEWRWVSLATGLTLSLVILGLYVAGSRMLNDTPPDQ